MNIPVLRAENIGEISSQREASDSGMQFEELCERRQDTILVQATDLGGSVLIIDDIYGSGGTIRALTSHLRALDAERILALTVTKTLKNCRQT